MAQIQERLAHPHSHANNASITLLFQQLTQTALLFRDQLGPQFCALPIDLQNHILLWYRENIKALEPLTETGTSLLQAILDFATASPFISLPITSLAASVLESVSKRMIERTKLAFPQMEAFSSALQDDFLTKLASPFLQLCDDSYLRNALFELDNGQPYGKSGPNRAGTSTASAINLDESQDEQMPNMQQEGDMELGLSAPDASGLGSFREAEGEATSSQPMTSSQHDFAGSTIEMDVDIPYLDSEVVEEATLSEEERNKILELVDKMGTFDSTLQSQFTLSHEDIGVLIVTPAHQAAIELLDAGKMSDESILAIMTAIIKEDASFARLRILLSGILLPRVASLTKAASRMLLNGLQMVGEKEPHALLDAVLVPMTCQKEFGAPHVELLIRIMKSLQPPLQEHYLENLFSATQIFTLSHLDLIAKLLPLRSHWPPNVIQAFVSLLHAHINDPIEGSKVGDKFETIVWSILQKYAAQDLLSHKEKLKAIISKFSTPLTEKNMAKLQQM
jgi:hypothetical protein